MQQVEADGSAIAETALRRALHALQRQRVRELAEANRAAMAALEQHGAAQMALQAEIAALRDSLADVEKFRAADTAALKGALEEVIEWRRRDLERLASAEGLVGALEASRTAELLRLKEESENAAALQASLEEALAEFSAIYEKHLNLIAALERVLNRSAEGSG